MRLNIWAPLLAAAFFGALALDGGAYGKDCVALGGGACQGHWACKTADGSAGFCDDDLVPKGTDCYCKKGPKTSHRAAHSTVHCKEDQPCSAEGEKVIPTTEVSQPQTGSSPTVVVRPGYGNDQGEHHDHGPVAPDTGVPHPDTNSPN
jgi:hypothetical protein